MDINHVGLTAKVLAELYPTSLILDDTTTMDTAPAKLREETSMPSTVEKITAARKWLGDNRKNILILVKSTEAVFLPDQELAFLTGVIGACKLSLADVAIVNLQQEKEPSYKELTAGFKTKVVLLFDTSPSAIGLPMSFPHYQVQAFAGTTFLYAPSLKDLENDRAEKTKLWGCLKLLFNL